MASNKKTLTDPDEPGEAPDWLELYNPGPEHVALDGLGLADGDPIETGYAIPNGITIPAGGFVIFYADSDEKQGPLHTNFGLSAAGESVILYRVATKEIIDRIDFPAMTDDQAYGRKPDGSGNIMQFLPAPRPAAPTIVNPPRPVGPEQAALSCARSAAGAGQRDRHRQRRRGQRDAGTTPRNGGAEQALPMGALDANVYATTIPGQVAGTLVTYYARAVDNEGETARTPLAGRERRYLAGYVAPVLLVNEIVLANSDQFVDPDEPAETPDWIEIFNPGPQAVSLNGMSLTDDNDAPLRFVMPDGLSLAAGERMMFLADDDARSEHAARQPAAAAPALQPQQVNEFVGLYGGQGTVMIDFYDVDAELPFGLAARIPDGGRGAPPSAPASTPPTTPATTGCLRRA